MSDMKNNIINEFEQLVKIGISSNTPNIKWKLINYKKVNDIKENQTCN